jgi:hypothetical protein
MKVIRAKADFFKYAFRNDDVSKKGNETTVVKRFIANEFELIFAVDEYKFYIWKVNAEYRLKRAVPVFVGDEYDRFNQNSLSNK